MIKKENSEDLFQRAKALFLEGCKALENGDLDLAENCFAGSLQLIPDRESTKLNLSTVFANKAEKHVNDENFIEALASYDRSLALNKENVVALMNKGLLLSSKLGLDDDAIACFEKVISILPDYALAHHNLSVIYTSRSKEKALEHGKLSVLFDPNLLQGWINVGNIYCEIMQLDEALKSFNQALELRPDLPEILLRKGDILYRLSRYSAASEQYDKALLVNPNCPQTWYNQGNAQYELRRFEEALESFNRAIALDDKFPEAWHNHGITLDQLKKYEEALRSFDQAIKLNAHYAEAWNNRGNTLSELNRLEDALDSYERALTLRPEYPIAWYNCANVLNELKHHARAADNYLKAYSLDGRSNFYLGYAQHQLMLICDWTDFDQLVNSINEGITKGRETANPFGYQAIAESEVLAQRCAQIFAEKKYPAQEPIGRNIGLLNRRIRVGYVCGEFRNQATSHLMTGVWENHDEKSFQIYGFDNGLADDSSYRKRIIATIPNFFDISQMSDSSAANLISEHQIDLLINLNGYFGKNRQGIFAYRPAPIQINYLGFPGTLGANYMDYLIADRIVIPEESRRFYTEKIIYMPHSYQANDDKREISNEKFTRNAHGLPEDGFIFCCFNNNYKINPKIFSVWMAILKRVNNSYLWLLEDNSDAKKNLLEAANSRGIDSSRIIFANRIDLPKHLSRHSLADLFLDTIPYNAHTTASDALWAGLPVLTVLGNTFPGRVGASLLNALDLTELVTLNLQDYESLAVELATKKGKLDRIRQKLKERRLNSPLFATKTFTESLEAAYREAVERFNAGQAPAHFSISHQGKR